MKRDKEQKSVEELLSQAIGAEPVRFDPEQWKQKYPQEVRLLAGRTEARILIQQFQTIYGELL